MTNRTDIPASSMQALLKAAHFAADKHRDQRRKGAEASPYINHPIAVAEILARYGDVGDLATIQAALLHDTIEDTNTTADELRDAFGDEVTKLVLEVSDDKTLPKVERKRQQVEHAPKISSKAQMIKMADKISNVHDIAHAPPAHWDDERRLAYFDWAVQVVDGCRSANSGLASKFDEAVANSRRELAGQMASCANAGAVKSQPSTATTEVTRRIITVIPQI